MSDGEIQYRVAHEEDLPGITHVRTAVVENHLNVEQLAQRGITNESIAASFRANSMGWVAECGAGNPGDLGRRRKLMLEVRLSVRSPAYNAAALKAASLISVRDRHHGPKRQKPFGRPRSDPGGDRARPEPAEIYNRRRDLEPNDQTAARIIPPTRSAAHKNLNFHQGSSAALAKSTYVKTANPSPRIINNRIENFTIRICQMRHFLLASNLRGLDLTSRQSSSQA